MRTGRVARWRRHDIEDPRMAGAGGGGRGEGGAVIDMQGAFQWFGWTDGAARLQPGLGGGLIRWRE